MFIGLILVAMILLICFSGKTIVEGIYNMDMRYYFAGMIGVIVAVMVLLITLDMY